MDAHRNSSPTPAGNAEARSPLPIVLLGVVVGLLGLAQQSGATSSTALLRPAALQVPGALAENHRMMPITPIPAQWTPGLARLTVRTHTYGPAVPLGGRDYPAASPGHPPGPYDTLKAFIMAPLLVIFVSSVLVQYAIHWVCRRSQWLDSPPESSDEPPAPHSPPPHR
eukprot:EG_transcript_20766